MNVLRFETNNPVQVALKYDGGRDVDGRYGPQVLYTLADGRLMYLEPKAARRIDELKITAGEPFSICKREARNGQKRTVEWEVKRLEPAPTTARLEILPLGGGDELGAGDSAPPAAEIEPGHVAQSSHRSGASDRQKPEPALTGSAATTLEIQLRASIAAAAGPPSSSDTRSARPCGSRVMISGRWPSPSLGRTGNCDERVPRHAGRLRR
jgi:hypothetical protein